ncbi:MAG: SDR family oxidoreductase [Rhizobiaceae bacterium]|nr:SDR family oxidoreductase [Rhizobiaceae bacterium]
MEQDKSPEIPAQEQERQPGKTEPMRPQPQDRMEGYQAGGKLEGMRAIITGGDSGIGRAVAIGFAKEGADVAIFYRDEHDDAETTKHLIEAEGRSCHLFAGEIGDANWCAASVEAAVKALGGLDILINNAAEQHPQERFEEISPDQLERTFRTNVFGMFHVTKAALAHLKERSAIVNTTSVTAYRGSGHLIDYASTKGAIVAFTRSLAQTLAERCIRVNAVAPGPIWTPLIPASFDADKVEGFGSDQLLGRAGQPDEVAPSYIFLASRDSSYMTGQVLHPNGGEIVNG